MKKYGVSRPAQSLVIKERISNTKVERYGSASYNNNERYKKTNLERYGVEYPQQSKNIRIQTSQTKLERYGDVNFNNRDKANETNLNRYGVESYAQKHISKETMENLNNGDWLFDQHHIKKKSLSQISKELNDVNSNTVGRYLKKNNIEIKHFYQSYAEKLLVEHIQNTYKTEIITNSRTIIKPKEIDIYLPEYKLAIEYNGIYWHRPEVYGDKEQWIAYHLNKINMCKDKDIQLLHLWENYLDHYVLLNKAIHSIIDNNLEKVYKEIYD